MVKILKRTELKITKVARHAPNALFDARTATSPHVVGSATGFENQQTIGPSPELN